MKQTIIILFALLAFPAAGAGAQGIGDVLKSIEQNNKELQALRKDNEAATAEIKSQNNLEDPSVEYSPFFRRGASGVASSELVVSQGFDFPTLYAARSKSGKLQRETLDLQYSAARRDILLSAKNLCFDLIHLKKMKALLDLRRKNTEELLALFTKKLENGGATTLEVNKIKMDLMNIQTEVATMEASQQTAMQSLTALNGNAPLTFNADDYGTSNHTDSYETMLSKAMASDYDILTAQASEQALEQEIKVNKQNWIPKLEIGYRRNTEGSEASNGFLVGASFPLFSSRNKMKTAKAQHEGAQLRLDNARIEVENRVKARIQEVQKLKKAKDTYDTALLNQTLDILRKAVEGGEISITDYYVEADNIYRNLEAYMNIERQYQGAVAEIYKNEL